MCNPLKTNADTLYNVNTVFGSLFYGIKNVVPREKRQKIKHNIPSKTRL